MKKLFLAISLFFCSCLLFSQDKVTLSGYIKDSSNGEALIGAGLFVEELKMGAVSNVYGFYSISIPPGSYTLTFSYVGFEKKSISLNIQQSLTKDIEMAPAGKVLKEVVVQDNIARENVESTEMSAVKLNINTIKKIPALLGEVDLVRSIQLLPGVTTVGEGATGFNVRGGSIDQNLILLDEAPVFNSSHLFGFFSVFNPDAVKDVKLIKGGIPSQYGGRLSSLLDVRMKEGNNKKFQGTGGVGAIFSRLALEGPIVKDKGSFIVAGRRSYIDVLAKPFLSDDLKSTQFYFYDLTAKANYNINKNNKIYVSGYFGRDVFSAPEIFGFDWGNATTTIRWNKLYSNRLFSNLTTYWSRYDYKLNFGVGENSFTWNSDIINYSIKPDFTYFVNPKTTLNFGGQSTYYTFSPGSAVAISEGVRADFSLPAKYGWENGLYIDAEQKVNNKLSLRYGLRYSTYHYLGKGTAYYYNDTTPNVRKTLERTESFDNNQVIDFYHNLEPRASVNYLLSKNQSVKMSYNRMAQYLHLISNTTASVPLDVWTPVTNNLPPQVADQIALGYFRNFKNDQWETSVEGYYKWLGGQVDYIDGADLLLNERLEADLLEGIGRAYGAEFYVKRNAEKLSGWVSYTLAWSERLVPGINNDEWFPVRFDRRHNINVVAMYQLNKKIEFSANFVLYTGTPATFPTNKYNFQGYAIPENAFNSRNNYRLPSYHRLDLSMTLQNKKRKRWDSHWVFSVYNVYNRRNPFSVYFQPKEGSPHLTQAVQFSVLGSFVPAVTYNFNF
jgi:hypothetical protein